MTAEQRIEPYMTTTMTGTTEGPRVEDTIVAMQP